MQLHGVDVYLWVTENPNIATQFGNLSLLFIANRGTRIYPVSANPKMTENDWPQYRFVSDAPVADAEIETLLKALSDQGVKWTKAQKLYRQDGNNLYSEPY